MHSRALTQPRSEESLLAPGAHSNVQNSFNCEQQVSEYNNFKSHSRQTLGRSEIHKHFSLEFRIRILLLLFYFWVTGIRSWSYSTWIECQPLCTLSSCQISLPSCWPLVSFIQILNSYQTYPCLHKAHSKNPQNQSTLKSEIELNAEQVLSIAAFDKKSCPSLSLFECTNNFHLSHMSRFFSVAPLTSCPKFT